MIEIWLETDLEPDDLFAIYLLAKKQYAPKYIVVGEGKSITKCARMSRYISLLQEEKLLPKDYNCTIIKGIDSKNIFPDDGKEFKDLNLDNDGIDYLSHDFYPALVKKYISESNNPIMVMLKPPRELVNCSEEIKSEISKVTSYWYGSFNFRSVWAHLHILESLLKQFKSTYIYESYHATGSQNSMQPNNSPITWNNLRNSNSSYIKMLLLVVSFWNNYKTTNCKEICGNILKKLGISIDFNEIADLTTDQITKLLDEKNADLSDRDKLHRNIKIYKSTSSYPNEQMVLADMGLAIMIDKKLTEQYALPGNISFDKSGFTQFKEFAASNVYLYKNIPFEVFEKEMSKNTTN